MKSTPVCLLHQFHTGIWHDSTWPTMARNVEFGFSTSFSPAYIYCNLYKQKWATIKTAMTMSACFHVKKEDKDASAHHASQHTAGTSDAECTARICSWLFQTGGKTVSSLRYADDLELASFNDTQEIRLNCNISWSYLKGIWEMSMWS